MLTALKELNLSFNYITKIENLETLVNLEVLSLFSNHITKIENLETLEKLVILSIGNNHIATFDGVSFIAICSIYWSTIGLIQQIERLRFVSSLKVLNLEGNPIAKQPDFPLSEYITAILPQLNYYEYVFIKDEMREAAQKKF